MAAMTLTRPNAAPSSTPGRARWATVRVETDSAVYVGRLFVPETKKRLSDVLCDDRPFLNLTEVSINESAQRESYVAVNKRYVRTVRVLHEGLPEEPRPTMRAIGDRYPGR